MQTLLSKLNAIPGVVGSLVCDSRGEVLGQVFPSLFDAGMLAEVARLLAEGGAGLESTTGSLRLVDLRFADARIVAWPLSGGYLLFLCASGADLQPLAVSTSIAVPQIERCVAARRSGSFHGAAGFGALESRPSATAPAPSSSALRASDPLTPAPALAALGPPPRPVPELYTIVQRIEKLIEQQRLDRYRVRGQIALKAGFALGFIDAYTPDDPAKVARLKAAVRAVLGESM